MADDTIEGMHADLYALIVYLHADSNRDLLTGIVREELSINQLRLLDRLRGGRRHPTIANAAQMLHVTVAAASRIVDGLARKDLVRRESDESDYRAKRIVITEKGERVVNRLHAARLEHVERFTDELDDDERKQLRGALTVLLEREPIAACRPLAPPA